MDGERKRREGGSNEQRTSRAPTVSLIYKKSHHAYLGTSGHCLVSSQSSSSSVTCIHSERLLLITSHVAVHAPPLKNTSHSICSLGSTRIDFPSTQRLRYSYFVLSSIKSIDVQPLLAVQMNFLGQISLRRGNLFLYGTLD